MSATPHFIHQAVHTYHAITRPDMLGHTAQLGMPGRIARPGTPQGGTARPRHMDGDGDGDGDGGDGI